MDIQTFIDNYQETFSGKAELPIAFWYSDTLSGELRKTQGCLFKARHKERGDYQHERRKHRLRRWEILYRIHSHAGTCT